MKNLLNHFNIDKPPRALGYLSYIFLRLVLEFLNLFMFFKFHRNIKRDKILCIESGVKGWELIEYKELYSSACEFLSDNQVYRISIDRNDPYISQLKKAISNHKPTHYIYDPRTSSGRWIYGLFQAIRVSLLFQLNGIIPICILTDVPVRRWRIQTYLVTAKRGLIITLMAPKETNRLFPHNRVIGPVLMPFSVKTMNYLEESFSSFSESAKEKITFSGSLYEPRTSILKQINKGLIKKGLKIEFKARKLGTSKFSDEIYWNNLISSIMVITTSNQIITLETDPIELPHLIYRYLEVPASGAILVAPKVSSIERYLVPDKHFISFSSVEEAVDKISFYMSENEQRENLRKMGMSKAKSLIEVNTYWLCIDTMLGKYSLH